ncbi:hypothetical protein BHAP_2226 [Bifidobacterium hapali]|uniref:Uncharacterized protein n=1 Tax=Bifidobacterium hapali TaxID=1630172 RepID=A0A261FRY5_9BIFI|nr:hypothetical protein BHAP_2226 [Bifidobacterium hapali]
MAENAHWAPTQRAKTATRGHEWQKTLAEGVLSERFLPLEVVCSRERQYAMVRGGNVSLGAHSVSVFCHSH